MSSTQVLTSERINRSNGGTKPHPLEGIVPPLITPLLAPDTLDTGGLERLVERVIGGGVHGIFILGTSGEAPCLSYRLRREVVQRVCCQVAGRIPVLVGITDTAIIEAVAMARFAAESGAQAVVAAPPYYFPAGQPELEQFIRALAQEVPLPLYLYNMPQMTKVQLDPETVRRVAGLEKIVGLKDSSGDLGYFRQLLEVAQQRPDWRVFIGPEHLLAESLRLGGHGGVNGGAQICPELLVGLYNACRRGETERAEQLHQKLLRLGEIYQVGKHASTVIKGMKCALSLLGVCSDHMTEPFRPFEGPERARIQAVLRDLELLN
jgi:4-hydroxy-tetrahydrodipicolinate synthase